jgi:NTE family protein
MLSDILRPGRPIVWINASDLYNRTPFLFSPLTFAALCSDPSRYPLSLAVAASAAVPVAFVPIVLANYPAACQTNLPPWISRVLASRSAGAQAKAFAQALERYRNADAMKFVKLADGGLTDNFGLSGLVIARAEEERPYAPLSAQSIVRLQRIVFIVVNAGSEAPAPWAKTVEGPSGAEMIRAISDTAIDSAVRSGFDAFRLTVREWEAAARKWRCSLPQTQARSLGAAPGWHCSNIKFEITEVAFNQLDPMRAAELSAIPTRFRLPPESVDALIDAGARSIILQLKK